MHHSCITFDRKSCYWRKPNWCQQRYHLLYLGGKREDVTHVQLPVFEAELGHDLLHLVHLCLGGRQVLRRIQSPYVISIWQVDDIET